MPELAYKTHHLGLLFDFNADSISNGSSGNIIRTIKILDMFNETIDIHGINYTVRWNLPALSKNPSMIGVGISRTRITPDIWDSIYDIKQSNTFIHFDSYSSYPIHDDIWYRNHPIRLKSSDKLAFGIFIDNDTGSDFTKIVRFHMTFFYNPFRDTGQE